MERHTPKTEDDLRRGLLGGALAYLVSQSKDNEVRLRFRDIMAFEVVATHDVERDEMVLRSRPR